MPASSIAGAAPGTIELPYAKASAYAKERGQQAAGADFSKALGGLGNVVRTYSRQAYRDGYQFAFHPDD